MPLLKGMSPENSSHQSRFDASTPFNKLLQAAALNNSALKVAYLKWQAELLQVYPAGALPDPQMSFTHYIQEVETRVGPQEQALTVMQRFPWFGKLDLQAAMQQEKARAAQASYDILKVKLFSEIEQIYYDFYYLQESLKIAKENKRLLLSFEPISRNLIKTGKSAKDLLKVQVELGHIEDRISGLKIRWIPLKSRMNELLNRHMMAPMNIIAVLPKTESVRDDSVLHNQMMTNNPELKLIDYRLAAAENKILLARKDFYPDLTLGLNYVRTTESQGNQQDDSKDPVMVTLGISLPLNQRKYADLEQATVKEFTAIRWSRQQKERQLERRLKMALYELEDNERVFTLYDTTLIPKNKQSLKITLQAYRNGKASFLELIDIQRQLLEFQLMQKKSLTKIHKQQAILRELTSLSIKDK